MKISFDEIVGQENVVSQIKAHINGDCLTHAYIFLGPPGTGKEFIARIFSKSILCGNFILDDCSSCKLFDRKAHPDFFYLGGDESIKIQEIRDVIERINLSPNISKKKVLLITGAERMGAESSNALLKTLEEPPEDTVIILTAVSEESLIQTIYSRAQKFRLNYLDREVVKKRLKKDYSLKEIEEVIDFSTGSIGDTINLLKSHDMLQKRINMYADVQKIMRGSSVMDCFMIIQSYEKNKELMSFFDIFSSIIFRSLDSDLEGLPDKYLEKYNTQEKLIIGKKILKIYSNLRYNINLRLAMEALILETTKR